MPDTVEHRVEMFRLAQERRNGGRPIWDRRIDLSDVFHNEEMTFEQRRNAIVARLRASAWLKGRADGLTDLVDELADTADGDEFDGPWDEIYDYADVERVWIATR